MRTDAVSSFRRNIAEVDQLVNFDKELLQLVTQNIEILHEDLKTKFGDDRFNGGRVLTIIRGIRDNDTIKLKYVAIYNQAVVLLVSHLSSALHDLFHDAVLEKLLSNDPGKLLDEEIKLTFSAMREQDWNLKSAAPELLIKKYDFSFQDMKTTVSAFKDYAGVTITRDVTMNNIIAAQACRHVIVHAGGRVSEKAVRQVSSATDRTLRKTLVVDEFIKFTALEVDAVKADMLKFIEKLADDISKNISSPETAS
jgi:hypothetical protein